ncbi:sugar transporter SWEET1 isoform X1 [Pocillopora verrucosa]|uniref:sugar transporter SWEET1 isoform X1 n=1 Tax=Pocillopora verrucosa TaxID=203993 RepID=UPI003340021D
MIPMDVKQYISWTATICQFGLLSTGIQVCLKIKQQGSTKNITFFPFWSTCLSSILWTKYGILVDDTPIYTIGILGMITQSAYLLFYYINTRDKKLLIQRLMYSFFGVCSLLTYVKYYTADFDTAVFHLGFIASGFTVAVYGSPLASVANVIRHKSTEFMTFSMCLGNFVVALLWAIYGQLVQDNFILVPNGTGVMLGSLQLLLFVFYPSTSQRTITYNMSSKPARQV